MSISSSPSSLYSSSSHFLGRKNSVKPASSAPAYVRIQPNPSSPIIVSSSASLYEVLGIPTGSTCQEIKAAYRKLARIYHPDVVKTNRKDTTSADEFMKIHAAYSTLSDPESRANYDRKLFTQQHQFNSPYVTSTSTDSMSRFSCCTRRKWETDQCW